jgi:hypothetical protein
MGNFDPVTFFEEEKNFHHGVLLSYGQLGVSRRGRRDEMTDSFAK